MKSKLEFVSISILTALLIIGVSHTVMKLGYWLGEALAKTILK